MRFVPKWITRIIDRHAPDTDTGGETALREAQELASEINGRWTKVERVASELDRIKVRNHLSEAVFRALKGNR